MHQSILEEVIRVCRQRRDDGDCPTLPAEPVERLEEAVLRLVHEDEEHLRQALVWHDSMTSAQRFAIEATNIIAAAKEASAMMHRGHVKEGLDALDAALARPDRAHGVEGLVSMSDPIAWLIERADGHYLALDDEVPEFFWSRTVHDAYRYDSESAAREAWLVVSDRNDLLEREARVAGGVRFTEHAWVSAPEKPAVQP